MGKGLAGCRAGVRCACGTLARDGGPLCDKCARRARWSRRKANRGFPGD
jgi:hypothetical protein